MDNVLTLTRRSWTERASLALAVVISAVGMWAVFGWTFHLDAILRPGEHQAPIKINEGLCFLAIGIALVCREFGIRRATWAAGIPVLFGALTALEGLFSIDLKIDQLFAHDALLVDTAEPGRGSVMASCCIALAGVTLLLRLSDRQARERLIAEAVCGS